MPGSAHSRSAESQSLVVPGAAEPTRRLRLEFAHQDALPHVDDPIREDLSALALAERTLWTACDETAAVERLTRLSGNSFGAHRSFRLADYLDGLPGDADAEIDIEGLAIDGGYLWLVGSHGLTRDKPKRHEKDAAEALKRLTEVDGNVSRQVLARVPLVEEEPGVWALAREAAPLDPAAAGEKRTAAVMKTGKKGSLLHKALKDDPHIGRFLQIPCKENGFDVEGLAVRGARVFLGLRGPVLRGWALLLELEMKLTGKGELKPKRIGPDGARYRKHFLDLEGLGIRDLLAEGDDLLLLAGPSMDLDGPTRLIRWPEGAAAAQPDVIPFDALERALELPFGEGTDHPEGIALSRRADGDRELLVVYDSPKPERLQDGQGILADVFAFP
jgi:hypothetical protein